MATFNKIIISLNMIFLVSGEPILCNDQSTLSADAISHCECSNGAYYNAYTGKCEGVCEFFGDNICDYGSNAVCVQHPNNATDFECECKSGYEEYSGGRSEDELYCVDANECAEGAVQCDGNGNETCVDKEGGDICACKDGFFRNADGECQELDLCNLQNSTNICYQGCNYTNHTYSCYCYEGFVLYKDYICNIDSDNGYTECQCDEDPMIQDCAERPDGTQLCYPSHGFQFASDNATIVDINECEEMTYQCPRGSNCVNDYGTYHCECFQYYHQLYVNENMDECVPITCETGKTLVDGNCIDPCLDLDIICPELSLCLADENMVPKCQCQIKCQNYGLSYDSTFSIYALTFYLPFEKLYDYFWSQKKFFLTRSMEAIFGRSNAEIVDMIYPLHDSFNLTFRIGVQNPVATSEIEDLVLRNCFPLYNSRANYCVLPGSFIINRYTVIVEEISNCDDWDVCGSYDNSVCDETDLSPGRFRCICKQGYEQLPDVYVTYCQDINECLTGTHNCTDEFICINDIGNYSCEYCSCNKYDNSLTSTLPSNFTNYIAMDLEGNLDDEEHDITAIGVISGTVFGAFIAFTVASVYIYMTKIRTESKNA